MINVKRKEKNMDERPKDEKALLFIPNESVAIFRFGDDIHKYAFINHEYYQDIIADEICDSYHFTDYSVTIWLYPEDHGRINSMEVEVSFIWEGHELINMPYSRFLEIFDVIPDDVDHLWSSGTRKNNRLYTVYDFDCVGLMLWVWRGRIRQIIVSRVPDKDRVNYIPVGSLKKKFSRIT
jgi:hypothetical protein